MPDIHLKYGGSTARRTRKCPAWPNIAADAPKISRESPAAVRGTMLHDMMEEVMVGSDGPEVILPALKKQLEPDDAQALQTAFDALEEVLDAYGVEDYDCEPLVRYDDDIGGSVDVLAWTDTHLLIIDYKFGYQPVEEKDQFLLYGMSAQEDEAFADIARGKMLVSVVIQPAVSSKPIITPHEAEEVDAFCDEFIDAVELSETGTKEGNPGDWCKYCPGAAYCDAKRAQVAGFVALDPKQADQLAQGMDLVDAMKEQIKAIEAETFKALEAGGKVPGWKLVLKRASRSWRDPAEAARKLRYMRRGVKREMYIEEKLRTPPQVEKAFKAAGIDFEMDEFITTQSSGTTLAPESDKREAVQPGVVPAALDDIIGK